MKSELNRARKCKADSYVHKQGMDQTEISTVVQSQTFLPQDYGHTEHIHQKNKQEYPYN